MRFTLELSGQKQQIPSLVRHLTIRVLRIALCNANLVNAEGSWGGITSTPFWDSIVALGQFTASSLNNSHFGIFGACLWRKTPTTAEAIHARIGLAGVGHTGIGLTGRPPPEILHNEEGGYLLRTKGKDSDEGGVAAGFSSLDSLILYE